LEALKTHDFDFRLRFGHVEHSKAREEQVETACNGWWVLSLLQLLPPLPSLLRCASERAPLCFHVL
jgi:hypothetical protein